MSNTRLHLNPGDPIGLLGPQDWMDAAETRAVLAALQADGAQVRFVGGCVRDALLKRPIKDIDIATPDPPERVLALLDDAGIHAIPTGIDHGTVTAVIGKAHYEITTLRVDVESFGRHARIQYTDDWRVDASRRDFTMNALSADPEGNVYDPFDGIADMAAGRVRFVGEPEKRIEEDALRLLRYFRFHAHYGRGTAMEARALHACRRMAGRLKNLSGERVAGELVRLLLADDPTPSLLVMHSRGILAHVLPEAKEFGRLRTLAWLERRGLARAEIRPDAMRRLAALIATDRNGAMALGERLKLSGVQAKRVAAMAAPRVTVDFTMDAQAARRALRKVGSDEFRDLTLVAWAGRRSLEARPDAAESERWIALLDAARDWVPVELPVKGRDLMERGVPHGPRIGGLLAALEDWWEERDYRPDRNQCLEKLKDFVNDGL
ncbi:tRNA nucleotidyltransferase [Paramagnetospirillum magnetotacticum MS-1]|uniref:tRNA nucleotidyltransferase n=1 Tax=Paramagnetospirillum magnetotacticum MS-1 TaxID=272627 RepID=A0A0C2YSD4_PARME|nr:CCA tRNA nucleotidyltransferase [Paramagnetospirillum magnetotacticum]KIL97600.1 tRNA nucleotidyltransferase [Paramagnetospirillum magnetotacticum MS-1]